MKHLLIVCTLCLVSCSTIPRPDLGIKKVGGKTYVHEQSTLCGKPVGKPRFVEVESKVDKLRKQLQKPALWTLAVSLPLGLVLAAVMMVGVGTPAIMKKVGSAAAICLTTSVLVGAWLAATYYLAVLIPLVIVGLVLAYRKTKHKKLTLTEARDGR